MEVIIAGTMMLFFPRLVHAERPPVPNFKVTVLVTEISPDIYPFFQTQIQEQRKVKSIKLQTLRFMMQHSLKDKSLVSYAALRTLAIEHGIPRNKRHLLIEQLESHVYASAAGIQSVVSINPSTSPLNRLPQPRPNLPKYRDTITESKRRADRRVAAKIEHEQRQLVEIHWWAEHWPQIESTEGLKEIMREHRVQTSPSAIERGSCSFCNRSELLSSLRVWQVRDLDIAVLENATAKLRAHYNIPAIASHVLRDDDYHMHQRQAVYLSSSSQLGKWIREIQWLYLT
ncbi:hypothetical protein C8J56DRAFT_906986 [Mycena floridula]|nr:hypothetical protein C8J56DRAFT_906986 [Mycena floridula]